MVPSLVICRDDNCVPSFRLRHLKTGPSCSKLMTLLVNVSLNFQKLISQICQYFLLKKWEKLLQASLTLFLQIISVFLVIKS